ncbi:MAG: carboxymuconolactone decarboxylase family protein [Marivibrio sp.]|uniref:carboxymuconolactone decarboxylase family protein n=1 Tax=Marivibrio sp. TaxID=2039719 RepID=UPI0032ED635B
MSADFPIHDAESAPAETQETLKAVNQKMGFLPAILGAMAESPAALEGYVTLQGIFDKTDFSPAERQLILLSVSYENDCHFCVAAHSKGAKGAGLDADAVAAVRDGRPIDDDKLEALRRFAQQATVERGRLDRQAVADFLAAGYSERQALDVVLGVAVKTLTNMTDAVVGDIPLNDELAAEKWDPASKKAA